MKFNKYSIVKMINTSTGHTEDNWGSVDSLVVLKSNLTEEEVHSIFLKYKKDIEKYNTEGKEIEDLLENTNLSNEDWEKLNDNYNKIVGNRHRYKDAFVIPMFSMDNTNMR